MRAMTVMTAFLALSAGPACAGPNAQTGQQTAEQKAAGARAQVEALLRGYHGLPERARFEAAADDPASILRAIAADPYAGPLRPAALEALKWWPDDATFTLYVGALDGSNPVGVRHKVLRYLTVFGDRAVPALTERLSDPDAQIRRTAATALFDLPGAAAGKALTEAAQREADPKLKAELVELAARRSSVR